MESGRWTVESGEWTVESGEWTVDNSNRQENVDLEQTYSSLQTVLEIMGLNKASDFEEAWQSFCKSIGLPMQISELVAADKDEVIKSVAEPVNMARLSNNPRRLSKVDIYNITDSAF